MRAALITGAGRGIGRATAVELAAAGWGVGLLARTRADLDRLAAELAVRGGRVEVLAAAVEEESAVRGAFTAFHERFGRLDALVNCAGTGSFSPAAEVTAAEWQRILSVNLTGTFLCCREALPAMRAQGEGHIVNVLSIAAKRALPGAAAYCASKWGALGFTRVLAEEVRRDGIKVTALCPGSVDTPFWESIAHSLDPGDMLRPGDVAAAIRFLLEQPPGIHVDELELMPPKGIL